MIGRREKQRITLVAVGFLSLALSVPIVGMENVNAGKARARFKAVGKKVIDINAVTKKWLKTVEQIKAMTNEHLDHGYACLNDQISVLMEDLEGKIKESQNPLLDEKDKKEVVEKITDLSNQIATISQCLANYESVLTQKEKSENTGATVWQAKIAQETQKRTEYQDAIADLQRKTLPNGYRILHDEYVSLVNDLKENQYYVDDENNTEKYTNELKTKINALEKDINKIKSMLADYEEKLNKNAAGKSLVNKLKQKQTAAENKKFEPNADDGTPPQSDNEDDDDDQVTSEPLSEEGTDGAEDKNEQGESAENPESTPVVDEKEKIGDSKDNADNEAYAQDRPKDTAKIARDASLPKQSVDNQVNGLEQQVPNPEEIGRDPQQILDSGAALPQQITLNDALLKAGLSGQEIADLTAAGDQPSKELLKKVAKQIKQYEQAGNQQGDDKKRLELLQGFMGAHKSPSLFARAKASFDALPLVGKIGLPVSAVVLAVESAFILWKIVPVIKAKISKSKGHEEKADAAAAA